MLNLKSNFVLLTTQLYSDILTLCKSPLLENIFLPLFSCSFEFPHTGTLFFTSAGMAPLAFCSQHKCHHEAFLTHLRSVVLPTELAVLSQEFALVMCSCPSPGFELLKARTMWILSALLRVSRANTQGQKNCEKISECPPSMSSSHCKDQC